MADRPSGNGPDEGTPQYDWLYGKGGSPSGSTPGRRRPSADDSIDEQATQAVSGGPEHTRMMPAVPRSQASDRQRSGGPVAPPQPPPRASRSRRRGFPRPRPRWIVYLLLLWLAYLVVVPIIAWNTVSEVDASPAGARPDEQPGTTYLLVGSDSRQGLSKQERKRLGTGNAEGRRTDTILLLHTGSGPNLLLSVPRDSLVEVPGSGTTKINAAFAFGGPKLLVRTIEDNTGIRVDHYVEIGFGGFVNVIDAVGGIEICPKQAIQDKDAKLDIKKGCQEADGPTALGYARSRKTYATGDIQRGQAQREVISSVGDKVISPWTVLNPFRYWSLWFDGADSVRVSEGTSAFTMGRFAIALARVSGGGNGLTCSVPIADLAVNWDEERSRRMFDLIINDKTDEIPRALCTPSGLPAGAAG